MLKRQNLRNEIIDVFLKREGEYLTVKEVLSDFKVQNAEPCISTAKDRKTFYDRVYNLRYSGMLLLGNRRNGMKTFCLNMESNLIQDLLKKRAAPRQTTLEENTKLEEARDALDTVFSKELDPENLSYEDIGKAMIDTINNQKRIIQVLREVRDKTIEDQKITIRNLREDNINLRKKLNTPSTAGKFKLSEICKIAKSKETKDLNNLIQ